MNNLRLKKRRFLGLSTLAIMFATLSSTQVQARDYPSKPVKIIVGFAAGTGPDVVARLLAQKLSEQWGNLGVIVDNKPGAAGMIAASEAARAPADGYTLLLAGTAQLSTAPSTYHLLPYDPQKDFVPVGQVVSSDFVLLVSPDKVKARNIKDFTAWAQTQKALFMATFGAGTLRHFGAYMFGDSLKIKPEVVHYRNTSDALGGLFNGDVQGVFASPGMAVPLVRGGKLVALGSTGASRLEQLPDVPTMKEQGLGDMVFSSWFGVVAPAKTAAEIVQKINADMQKALLSADGKSKMENAGFSVTGGSAQQFSDLIALDTSKWRRAVLATGFKAD